jgi:PHD/YefM family antitoxin component YafN of YafNO toxin-antitoxin module
MQSLPAETEDVKVRKLIAAARKEPVMVLEDGEPAAVVLSPAEYERLGEADRIRREAKARLLKTIAAVQAEAAKSGLTEAELGRLWADES